jgi:hypothetical protein
MKFNVIWKKDKEIQNQVDNIEDLGKFMPEDLPFSHAGYVQMFENLNLKKMIFEQDNGIQIRIVKAHKQ